MPASVSRPREGCINMAALYQVLQPGSFVLCFFNHHLWRVLIQDECQIFTPGDMVVDEYCRIGRKVIAIAHQSSPSSSASEKRRSQFPNARHSAVARR